MAKQPKKPKFDPVVTLRAIAADPEAGSTARVQACKALIQYERESSENEPEGKNAAPTDAITQRALRLLKGGKQ